MRTIKFLIQEKKSTLALYKEKEKAIISELGRGSKSICIIIISSLEGDHFHSIF